jgi:hypothetical protein
MKLRSIRLRMEIGSWGLRYGANLVTEELQHLIHLAEARGLAQRAGRLCNHGVRVPMPITPYQLNNIPSPRT